MNWDRIAGSWMELRGKIQEQWGKLTDDDMDVISGKYDQLIGSIQRRYAITRDEAENQVEDWMAVLDISR